MQQSGLPRISRNEFKRAFARVHWNVQGRVCDIVGTIVEARLPESSLGTFVTITSAFDSEVLAEVVGFRDDRVLLLPFSSLEGIAPGCPVKVQKVYNRIQVNSSLLGQVIDPFLKPLGLGKTLNIKDDAPWVPIDRPAPNPMERERITTPISLGVRALDGLLTFGDGQRIGIMAGSGVGKSVLMGMIARGSEADVNVIGLIGERGREVKEFIERDLGPEGLARSVVVVVTGDQSPLLRVRGAKVTTAIAEYFAAQGRRVVLMMDSLTRVAMAQREIGLAIGEPPTTKGYTPSVFSLLPRLLERTGPQEPGKGSISGLYTVLVDGDDLTDPIADAARSILDGHINLSRALAAKGHFPAIEVSTSASRVMYDICSKDHWALANRFRMLLGVYQENVDLIQIGAYQRGTNPKLDEAIDLMPAMERYLRQDIDERSDLDVALSGLAHLLSGRPMAKNDIAKAG